MAWFQEDREVVSQMLGVNRRSASLNSKAEEEEESKLGVPSDFDS
jgi:hypothetical protein